MMADKIPYKINIIDFADFPFPPEGFLKMYPFNSSWQIRTMSFGILNDFLYIIYRYGYIMFWHLNHHFQKIDSEYSLSIQ